jgi:uncharacterized protein (DUF58 family)
MIRPTLRGVLLFSAGIPAIFVILAWDPSLWSLATGYSLLALAALGADALLILPARRLQVGVTAASRLPVADKGEVAVVLLTLPLRRPVRFDILLEMSGAGAPPPLVGGRSEDGRLETKVEISSTRRGNIAILAIWLRWRGPLGLVEKRQRRPLAISIDVVPVVRRTRGALLEVLSREAMFGSKVQRLRGEGAEFESLREHGSGLDNRFIDWKRSARHRKLLSKEFRIERNHQIVLAFDTGHLMLEPIEGMARLDHAIEAGLLLGWTSLRGGDLVGSYGFDAHVRHYLQPGRGVPYLARIQRAVARLQYRSEETNFTLGLAELYTRLKRRALVILFTEFVDSISAELLIESLQRTANRHAVIFVTLQDPMLTRLTRHAPDRFEAVAQAVIAHEFQRERAVVLERIARLGVHCLDVEAGGLSMGLINRYFEVKQKGLI